MGGEGKGERGAEKGRGRDERRRREGRKPKVWTGDRTVKLEERERKKERRKVRSGTWTVGFLTGERMRHGSRSLINKTSAGVNKARFSL